MTVLLFSMRAFRQMQPLGPAVKTAAWSEQYPAFTPTILSAHAMLCHVAKQFGNAGGQFTGAALNPARVLGPAIVFHCYWDTAFVYVFGELFGGLLAAVLVLPLYGFGQFGSLLDTRVCTALGIKIPEKHQHRSMLPLSSTLSMHGACKLEHWHAVQCLLGLKTIE